MTKQQILYMIQYARALLKIARAIPSKDYERQAWKCIREIKREIKAYNQDLTKTFNKAA